MAATKLVSFLLLALCATTIQPLKLHQVNPQVNGLIDDVLALLQALTETVTDAIASAVGTVQAVFNTVLSSAGTILDDLTSSLDGVVAGLLGKIDALIKEAAEAGVDVTECIGSSKDDITGLAAQLLSSATDCVTDQVVDAAQTINKTIIDIESTADILVTLGQGILDCSHKSILLQPICFAGLTAQIALDTVSIPLRISGDVASITQFVAALLPSLKICAVGVAAELGVQGAEVVTGVTTCVNEKLHP